MPSSSTCIYPPTRGGYVHRRLRTTQAARRHAPTRTRLEEGGEGEGAEACWGVEGEGEGSTEPGGEGGGEGE